jgi:hypothetical protein
MATPANDNTPLRSNDSSGQQQAQFDFEAGTTNSSPGLDKQDAEFRIGRAREALERAGVQAYDMREPCSNCVAPSGYSV